MEKISDKVGVQGRLIGREWYLGSVWGSYAEIWQWKAQPGQLMCWAQDLGMEWNDPSERRRYKEQHLNFFEDEGVRFAAGVWTLLFLRSGTICPCG